MSQILILGGTQDARILADRASVAGHTVTLSLAGRTSDPILPACRSRTGGFGGPEGLARYLRDEGIEVLIDATHPFARIISANARRAAAAAGVRLLALGRPAWIPVPGDRWTRVTTTEAAARALGPHPARVLLTIGRQEVAAFRAAPQHAYLIRSVEPPDQADLPPIARTLLARGPFTEPDERALIEAHRIEILVTKNSGGAATYAKIAAARTLGLTVVVIDRPAETDTFTRDEILAHLAAPAENRGV